MQNLLRCPYTPPPFAIASINICAHVKDPVVHVRVGWIRETLKHPACTVGWVARLCRSWLSPGKATGVPHGRNPIGTIKWCLTISTECPQVFDRAKGQTLLAHGRCSNATIPKEGYREPAIRSGGRVILPLHVIRRWVECALCYGSTSSAESRQIKLGR